MDIALRVAGGVRGLVGIRVMGLRSCRLQYNRIDQTCGHNQDSIEICSAQQAGAGGGLLYTGTGSSGRTRWRALTGSRPHAGPHVDNVDNAASPITLLRRFVGDSVFALGSRPNLGLPVERPVTFLFLLSLLSEFCL